MFNGQREMRADEFLKLCVALRIDPRSFVTREMVERIVEASNPPRFRYHPRFYAAFERPSPACLSSSSAGPSQPGAE